MDYNSYSSYDTYSRSYAAANADAGAMMVVTLIMMLFILIVTVFMIIAMWRLFTKAGKPGWAAIVPFYNIIVMLEIVGRPMWWLAMFFIPVANVIFQIMLYIDLAKAYGKGSGYAVLLILFPYIGFPMLAFGNAAYIGPIAADGAGYAYGPQTGYTAQPYQQQPQQQSPQQDQQSPQQQTPDQPEQRGQQPPAAQ